LAKILVENPLRPKLNSLAYGLVAITGTTHGTFSTLDNTTTSPLLGALTSSIDNQFNYVSGSSGALQVAAAGTQAGGTLQPPLAMTGIPMTKSGFLYIYVSNAAPGWEVFFDNLSVKTYAGPMLEENHYYPYGLLMQGISDRALKANYAENKYRFNQGTELQDKEFSDGSGLEEYATVFRNYDPQLGRFHGIDQMSSASVNQSPYSFAINNPLRYVDPLGLDTTTTQVKDGKIQIKAHAEKGDVLKIMGKDGNASYYTYDPDNKDANQQGYVGSGTEDTEQAVTVTAKKEEKSGNAPPWLLIAAGEAAHGVRRNADGTNNPRILEYLHTVDPRVNSENTPWCAGCVNWSLQQAGIQGDNSLYAMDFAIKKWGQELNNPALGAIVVFNHHVGFIAGINADGRLVVLGGNQGPAPNGVNYGTRSASSVLEHGYRYPTGYTPNYNLPKYNIHGHVITFQNTR